MSFAEEYASLMSRRSYSHMVLNGVHYRYLLAGRENAQTVILLNGGMNCSEMWMRYVEALSREYQLLLFDYPGECPRIQPMLEAMHDFFGALGIERPLLVGASFGGLVAQLYTQRYPDSVGGLVLISTGALDRKSLRTLRLKFFFAPLTLWYMKHSDYEKLKPKLIQVGCNQAKHESPERQAYAKDMFTSIFADYTKEKDLHITGLQADLLHQTPVTPEDFAALAGKILLILPSDDFFSPKMQQSLVELMHSPERLTIDGGHLSTIFQADRYVQEIQRHGSRVFSTGHPNCVM